MLTLLYSSLQAPTPGALPEGGSAYHPQNIPWVKCESANDIHHHSLVRTWQETLTQLHAAFEVQLEYSSWALSNS